MKRSSILLALGVLILAGCSHNGSSSTSAGAGGTASTAAGAAGSASPGGAASAGGGASAAGGGAGGDQSCTGGLKGTEPGVVRITCGGTATIQVQAGGTSKAFHGGACQSTGDYWSAAAGVIIDVTGTHGQYTGPKVDSVALNNTDTPGKGTIQLSLGGKNLYDLGGASLTLSADKKTAHFAGTSGQLSDAPGTKLVVDVTC